MRGILRTVVPLLTCLALSRAVPAAEAGAAGETKPINPGEGLGKILTDVHAQAAKAREQKQQEAAQEIEKFKKELDAQLSEARKGPPPFDAGDPGHAAFKSWTLETRDFKFDLPMEIYVPEVAGPQGLGVREHCNVILPFTITNSLDRKADLTPRFTMVTEYAVSVPECSGFLARETVEFSTLRRREWTEDMLSFMRGGEAVGSFEPGQTRLGVAVFPRFDQRSTRVQILVEGLCAEFDFRRNLRKALVLEFVRPGDVVYPGRGRLQFQRHIGRELMDPRLEYVPARDDDVHHGFDWVWLWHWDRAARTGDPKRAEVPAPLGDRKLGFWYYKVLVPNRTEAEQPLTVERVSTVARVELLGHAVDVPLVDDGKMNVFKAALFDAEGLPVVVNRFPENARVEPTPDRPLEFLVAFGEKDYDLDAVLRNLVLAMDVKRLRAAQEAGPRTDKEAFVGVGVPQLSAEQVEQVKKELAEKLPAALAEQLKETVVADVTARSGLASGVRRVVFSLYKPKAPAE